MSGNEEFRIVAPAYLGTRVIERAAHLEIDIHQFTIMAWENQLATAELSKGQAQITTPTEEVPSMKREKTDSLAQQSVSTQPQEDEDSKSNLASRPTGSPVWRGLRLTDMSDGKGSQIEFGAPVHLDKEKYLWGQCNRFLPIKMTLRKLLGLGNGSPVDLYHWQSEVRNEAASWRQHLREMDKKLRIRRGSQLASAFPKDEEKSLNRFIDHFTASVQGVSGPVVGLAAELGLIEVDGVSKSVRLTNFGYEYVMLENPILDQPGESRLPMTDAERAWMKSHLKQNLIKEARFMSNILRAISQGHDTRLGLLEVMTRAYGPNSGRGWTEEMVSTNQGGALARMGALGLIGRRWEYRTVHYLVNDAGMKFIGGE